MESQTCSEFFASQATLEQFVHSVEREIILHSLERNRWNRTRAAQELGLTFRAMRYRMEKLGVEENGAGHRRLPAGFNKAWPALREAAFSVFGRACNYCGGKAAEGIKLHVDHVKPIRDYPELALDLSNLQVLCESCNLKKGARTNTIG